MTANHIITSSKWGSDRCPLLPEEGEDDRDTPVTPDEGEDGSAPAITDHTPAVVSVNGSNETCPTVVQEACPHPPHPPGTECSE